MHLSHVNKRIYVNNIESCAAKVVKTSQSTMKIVWKNAILYSFVYKPVI